ncbi:MAG: hypothetical protein HFI85_02625 [Clostridia bacterium]|jgi:hypothetical protein|nr:hypothetical protein [Clostridia bacterium]
MKKLNRREQTLENILLDIKRNLPKKEITAGGALAYLNGLALVYRKTISDYEPAAKVVYEVNMKEVLFSLYKKGENRGKDCGFNEAFDLYFQTLPKEFVDLVNINLFRGNFDKKKVEKELTKLTYKISIKAASLNMRVKKEPCLPSLDDVKTNIKNYRETKRVLREGLGDEIGKKKGGEGLEQMGEYVENLAKKIISSEVEYATNLAESVVRFYSNVELDRQAAAREAYFKNHVYVDKTL